MDEGVGLAHKVRAGTRKVDQPDFFGETARDVTWRILCGDARQEMSKLPAESFSCIVTSPPYYWLRDYGVEGQMGQEETVNDYVDSLTSTMDECYRVLQKTGILFLNLGDTYYSGKGMSHGVDKKSGKRRFGLRAVDKSGGVGIGIQRKGIIGIPWRVALAMSKKKWVLRSAIIWHRHRGLPEPVTDRPSRSYEYIFMFVKERHYFFNREALKDRKIEEDLWTIAARPKPTNGIETAPFPDELVERCLALGCPLGGAVLDPFMGSGTTLRVALRNGSPCTGIDLNPKFCEYAAKSLEQF